ncbi:MAG: hypothetical protein E6Q97_39410 [Desulfurellales bacterium]|nr:MAG: hypothetical protein E6Q97_39410 [Desulfurellales bacterium]
MGDRGNIKCGVEKSVWIYSHWHGSSLPVVLQKALNDGRKRWGDESYLNRIIAQAVMDLDPCRLEWVGISPEMTDNEHHILEVDHDSQRVRVLSGDDGGRRVLREWDFAEYVRMPYSELKGVI